MGDSPLVRSIETLPERFTGSEAALTARFRLHIGRAVRDVIIDGSSCEVAKANGARPDVEILTSPETWMEMNEGRLSGIEAFASKRLNVRGSIEKSLLFEPLFERPAAGALSYELGTVDVGRARYSVLSAGPVNAPPLVMLHGLGATKSSWLPIVPALARRYRVIVPDLPGFGASSKPRGRYDAHWFSHRVFALLDHLGHREILIAGNSMGGRIAQEMAMLEPGRVRAIAGLCPVTAFSKRPALLLVRLLRPELSFFASRLPRNRIKESLRDLFASGNVAEEWYEAALDDFMTIWRSPRARMAFSAAARNIYLDEPEGERGFWTRLKNMGTPAFYIFGKQDALITHHFARKVSEALPNACVEVWDRCGHVPQIEYPERASRALLGFFQREAQSDPRAATA